MEAVHPVAHVRRFEGLDGWRGVAAIAVALFHLPVLNHTYGLPLVRHAYLFVDFFFVLSGFVISQAYRDRLSSAADLRRFAIRRFGRVWPVHAVMLITFVSIEALKLLATASVGYASRTPAFSVEGPTALAALPAHLLLLQAFGLHDRLTWNEPSWSIGAEFWTYLVFGLACVALPRARRLTLGALLVVSALIVVRSGSDIDVTYDLGFWRCMAGFTAGCAIFVVYQRVAPTVSPVGATCLEVAAVAAVMAFVSIAGRSPWSFAAPLVFALVILVFSYERGAVSKLLRSRIGSRLGAWSYAIYMVHALVALVLGFGLNAVERAIGRTMWHQTPQAGQITRWFDPGNLVWGDLLLVLYLVTVIFLSWTTHRFVEVPARAWFNRRANVSKT